MSKYITKVRVDSLNAASLLNDQKITTLQTKDKLVVNDIDVDLNSDLITTLQNTLEDGVEVLGFTPYVQVVTELNVYSYSGAFITTLYAYDETDVLLTIAESVHGNGYNVIQFGDSRYEYPDAGTTQVLGFATTVETNVEFREQWFSGGNQSYTVYVITDQDEIVCKHGSTKIIYGTPATCTEDGSTDSLICTQCNAVLTPSTTIKATGHTYKHDEGASHTCSKCGDKQPCNIVKVDSKAPTCTVSGYDKYECSVCDYESTTTIPATGHTPDDPVRENFVDSTCTTHGSYDSVKYCIVCEQQVSRSPVSLPLKEHTAGAEIRENQVAVTCETDGSYDTVKYCTVCETELSRVKTNIPATGHKDSDNNFICDTCGKDLCGESDHIAQYVEGKPATCTESGYTDSKKCSRCGEILEAAQYQAPKGHRYTESITAPTCTDQGFTTFVCLDCGYSYNGNFVSALSHDMSSTVTKDATCTGKGELTYTCQRSGCGYSYKEDILAHGHDYVTVGEKQPTCTEDGYSEHLLCKVCKETSGYHVEPALGHNIENSTEYAQIDANDPFDASYRNTHHHHVCNRCHEAYSKEPHEFNEANSTETAHICTICNQPVEHDWATDTWVSVYGENQHYRDCKVCGKRLYKPCNPEIDELTGKQIWFSSSTNHTQQCMDCGRKDLNDHTISWGPWMRSDTDDSIHIRYCTVCGTSDTHKIQLVLTDEEYTDPTCITDGSIKRTYSCGICGMYVTTENEIIDASEEWHNESGSVSCTTDITCTTCGKILKYATGHSYAEDGKDGWEYKNSSDHSRTCMVCGETEEGTHNFGYISSGNTHYGYCDVCCHELSSEEPCEYAVDQGSTEGRHIIYCPICGSSYEESCEVDDNYDCIICGKHLS